MLLAFAGGPYADPSFPIAAVCVSTSNSKDGVLFVGDDWEKRVKDDIRSYIEESFSDWARWMDCNRGLLPPNIVDLSVGPFRTVQDDECDEQDLIARVESFFSGLYRRFA